MTIDEYILAQDKTVQPILLEVCRTIRLNIGEAEERLSW